VHGFGVRVGVDGVEGGVDGLAGGGAGALIGGPVGAGAGTAAAILTNKKDVKLPAETHLTFKLSEPVSIPAKS